MGELDILEDSKGRRRAQDPCLEPCPIERGMRLIGGKWTGSILWHLRDKPLRFNDLARQLGGASKKVLADRLKQMEENKLVTRKVISDQPFAVSYELTEFGATALSLLNDLKNWSIKHGV